MDTGSVMQVAALSGLDDRALREAYEAPRTPWFRLNFVTTVDGAVTGADGLSGGINNAADHRVYRLLRELADVIIAGAGTMRAEGYRAAAQDLVVVSRSGQVPASLRDGPLDRVWMATGSAAPHLGETRELLGERCLVLGEQGPDLVMLRDTLVEHGHRDLLCEGGPGLAHDLLQAGVVDELCLSVVPRLAAGDPHRLLHGADLDVDLQLAGMLQDDSTLLQRWFIRRG